jgi:hypothetical protein
MGWATFSKTDLVTLLAKEISTVDFARLGWVIPFT